MKETKRTMKSFKLKFVISLGLIATITAGCSFSDMQEYFNETLKCDSPDVKGLVVESFKENSNYYKSIDESSIGSITLMYPRAVDYNKDINVYKCAGDIVIKAAESSFSPKDFNPSNLYYSYITYFYNAMMQGSNIAHYDTYTVNAEYKTQISEGKLLVTSWFDNENLSCEDACKQAIEREKIQKKLEREAEKQVEEHIVLPD